MTELGPELPPADLLALQADWLGPARARLLRRAGIARKASVLDLGAGFGSVSGELARRSRGRVIALDRLFAPLRQLNEGSARPVAGDGRRLPFVSGAFDLVFCQCVLLWISPVRDSIAEIHRVLSPDGICIALEPDYGAMIEHPESVAARRLWLSGLARAGADPTIGRRLPGLFGQAGFTVDVRLLERLQAPSYSRFDFLRDLPLNTAEQQELGAIERASRDLGQADQLVHLPFFLLTAVPGSDAHARRAAVSQ